jgi:uncharacterized lipoprotein YbaY
MKTSPLSLLAALGALFSATACSHLDLTPEGDPSRELHGTVTLRADVTLPPDSVVVVRVLDTSGRGPIAGLVGSDLPVLARVKPTPIERELGKQIITAPGAGPIPFHVEYSADDDLLRRGLNVDVRISFGGRVQYRTANAHLVTLSSANLAHEVWVEAAAR